MTDNEIIKAFDCCNNKTLDCDECPCHYKQEKPCLELDNLVFDLINRQKAEIKRLEKDSKRLKKVEMQLDDAMKMYDTIKAEAIKEFAENAVERVEKAKLKYQRLCKEQGEEMEEVMHIHFNGIIEIINNLLKEMEGENNA